MGLLASIDRADVQSMRRINGWHAPAWFRWWMIGATRLGDGWLWYGIAILLFFVDPQRQALRAMGIAGAVSVLIYVAMKRVFNRTRPAGLETHAWARVKAPDRYSFPSGHTLAATAVAVALSPFYPAWSPALFFAAASIGASRIFLGVHYPSDVLAGIFIGILVGAGVNVR